MRQLRIFCINNILLREFGGNRTAATGEIRLGYLNLIYFIEEQILKILRKNLRAKWQFSISFQFSLKLKIGLNIKNVCMEIVNF